MSLAFDTLEYTKGAEVIGIKREHAEYQAQQMAKIINNNLVTKRDLKELEVATKRDFEELETSLTNHIVKVETSLRCEIKEMEYRITIKMGAMMIVQTGLIISILGFVLRH